MDRGGAAGLEIQMEGDEDDDIDEKALEDMSDEDKLMLEQQFEHLYKNDPRLKEALNAEPSELPLLTKYQVILQYQRVNDSGTEGQKEEQEPEELPQRHMFKNQRQCYKPQAERPRRVLRHRSA